MLQQYGSMDNLYANTSDLKGKLKERIEENKDQAFLSRKLATIIDDVPVEFDEVSLRTEQPNEKAIHQLFEQLEFRTLSKRVIGDQMAAGMAVQGDLFGGSAPNEPGPAKAAPLHPEFKTIETTEHSYQLVENQQQIDQLLAKLQHQKTVCFDTETTSLNKFEAELLGLAISFKSGEGYYVSMPRDFEECKARINQFQDFFANPEIEKIAQNIKYDMMVLHRYGIRLEGPLFDTMLAHYLIAPDKRHNMDILAEQYLNYKPISIETLIGKKGKNQLSFESVDLEKATEYAVEDADITLQLKEKLAPLLDEGELKTLFQDLEIPLVKVLAAMELEGVKIDDQFLTNYSKELEAEVVQLEKDIHEISGSNFNIASPKQLGEVLFDLMKLDPKAKKTRTGQYKTDEETLQKLAGDHEIVAKVLDYRQIQKLKSTYVDALPKLVQPQTGRVHTSFAQAVAATGRLSSNNPNLQNIPIRTEKGREIRKAFVPRDENHILFAADYSQIELRVIASISEDEGMMDAFLKKQDIHRATAARVFGVDIEAVDSEMRRRAKTVNFGVIYGISAFGLSQRVGISRTEAKEIIDAYFEQFPGIKNYMDNTIEFCRKNGYVQTLMGRRRHIPDINSNNRTVVGFAERNAINAPIQGTAADMIKKAMIRIHHMLLEKKVRTKMILQVHDELLFDMPKDEYDELAPMIQYEMENAMTLKVPVVVDTGFGEHWLQAH